MPDHYDVIVIGTGAGGGTLAHTLAGSGKRILLLERGNFLPRETQNWDPESVFVDGKYISPDTWYDADGTAFQPQVHYFVGGATKLYGAALYRLRPQDFGEIKHVDGISPAWPVGYDEFEPWYTKAEWLYQVHGNHGDDPTEGHWSKQYPWPAVSHEPRIQEIADDLAAAGYHPFSAPCGILLDEADRPAQHVHPLHVVRRLPVHGARQVRRRDDRRAAAADGAERDVARRGRGGEAGDRPVGSKRHRRRRVARRSAGGLRGGRRRRVGRRVEQRQAPPPVGERPASQRARQRLRPGRAQLHVPQLQGRGGAGQGAQRHGVPEDARPQRLLPRRHRATAGRSGTSRWSASPTAGR